MFGFEFETVTLLWVTLVFFFAVLLAELFVRFLEMAIGLFISRTKTTLDDRLFSASRWPMRALFLLAAGYGVTLYLHWNGEFFGRTSSFWFFIAGAGLFGHLLADLTNAFLKWYGQEFKGKRFAGDAFPMVRKIMRAAIYLVTFVFILSAFSVEVGPLLAGLGIAGLAVALALQSTLANFFSGVYLLSDKPIRVGDYVAIDGESSGIGGFVKEIGWRTTKIRSFANTVFILPNDKIANSVIVNYSSARESGRSVKIEVNVGYESDPNKVERLLKKAVVNAAKAGAKIYPAFEPIARFQKFGESALVFQLIFRVNSYVDRWRAEAAVNHEILKLFRKNKVHIPYPIHTVQLKK